MISIKLMMITSGCAAPEMVRGLIFSEGVYHFEGWSPGAIDPLPPDVLDFLGAGHGLPSDEPDLCNRLVLDFIAEVSS